MYRVSFVWARECLRSATAGVCVAATLLCSNALPAFADEQADQVTLMRQQLKLQAEQIRRMQAQLDRMGAVASAREPATSPPPASGPVKAAAEVPGASPLTVVSGNGRVKLTLSGQINRDFIAHSDGSGKVNTYFADNNVSSSRLRALATAAINNDTSVTGALEFDMRSNSSASVSRTSSNNNGEDTPILGAFRIRRAEMGISSQTYGTVLFGRGSTYADLITAVDYSGTFLASSSGPADMFGGLKFADRYGTQRRTTDPSVAQVLGGIDGPRDDRIRYDSPQWNGLSAGGSIGQGGYWDVGARYAASFAGTRVGAAIAYIDWSSTLPARYSEDGSSPAILYFTRTVAGSASVMLPSGLNLTAAASWSPHNTQCCAGVANDQDSVNWYTKAGYAWPLFYTDKPFAVSVDYGQTYNQYQNNDTATRVGVAVGQTVFNDVELYASLHRITLDRPGSTFLPSIVGLTGARLQF